MTGGYRPVPCQLAGPVRLCLRTATLLVADHEDASDMPLRDLTRVEGRDQVDSEIVRRSAVNAVRDSERKVVRAWNEERLHDIPS